MQGATRSRLQPAAPALQTAAAALPLLSPVPMPGAQPVPMTAAGGKPLPAVLDPVVEAGGKPLPTTQTTITAAGGNPLPAVSETEELAEITHPRPPTLPPLVMPYLADLGQQFSAATTLKTIMSQAGWQTAQASAEKPLWRWLLSIAEHIATIDGQPTLARPKPIPKDALASIQCAHSRMDKQHATTTSMYTFMNHHM